MPLVLFLTFFKIGLFTFGGGLAMISIIENTCVERKKWITHDEMMDMTVIAESTPGPIAINCATFIGYRQGGLLGSVCATLGVVMPSFIIIYIISMVLNAFLQIAWIAKAFKGIQLAVGLLIVDAGINMFRKMKKTVFSYVVLGIALLLMLAVDLFAWDFSSIYMILLSAAAGALVFAVDAWKNRSSGDRSEGEK